MGMESMFFILKELLNKIYIYIGDIYKGKWLNEKRHGRVLICNDGSLKNGVWKDDKLLEQF